MRLFLVFLCFSISVYAQPPKYILGKVLDLETGRAVSNASVINKRTQFVGRTNHLGNFYIQLSPGDSVIITSPTHGRAGIRWDGATKDPVVRMKRQLSDDIIDLPELTVRGKQEAEMKRELQQLLSEPEARKNLSMEEAVGLASSPVTLLYELFSKRAKADRKLGVLLQEDRRRKLAGYRLDLIIGRATDLKGDEIDQFKEYCQFGDLFVLQASEYELTYAVLQRFKSFQGGK